MRPIPPRVSELYPPPPGAVRERPWWRCADGYHIERIDGSTVYDLDEVADLDKRRPLPHPGFRAGQVWVVPDGDTFSVVVLVEDRVNPGHRMFTGVMGGHKFAVTEAELRREFAGAFLLADPCCPWLAPWSPVAP